MAFDYQTINSYFGTLSNYISTNQIHLNSMDDYHHVLEATHLEGKTNLSIDDILFNQLQLFQNLQDNNSHYNFSPMAKLLQNFATPTANMVTGFLGSVSGDTLLVNNASNGKLSGGVTGNNDAQHVKINIQGEKSSKPAMIDLNTKGGSDLVEVLNTTKYAKITGNLGMTGDDTDALVAGGDNVEYQVSFGKESDDNVTIAKGSNKLTGSFTMGGVYPDVNNTVTIEDGTNNKLSFYQAATASYAGDIQKIDKFEKVGNKYKLTTKDPDKSEYTFDHTLKFFELNGKTYEIPKDIDALNTAIDSYVPPNANINEISQLGGVVNIASDPNYQGYSTFKFTGDKLGTFNYSTMVVNGTVNDETFIYDGSGKNRTIFFNGEVDGTDTLKFEKIDKKDLYVQSVGNTITLIDTTTGTYLYLPRKSNGDKIDKLLFDDGSEMSLDDIVTIGAGKTLDGAPYGLNGGYNYDQNVTLNHNYKWLGSNLDDTVTVTKGVYSAATLTAGSGNDTLIFNGFGNNWDGNLNTLKSVLQSELDLQFNNGGTNFSFRDRTTPNATPTEAYQFEYITIGNYTIPIADFINAMK